jgi:hypothetical protein
MSDSKLTGGHSGLTREGVGYEIHYSVEQNTKGFNRKMSVGLFYQGGENIKHDEQVLGAASVRANDLAFQGQNRLENKIRRMNGWDIIDPVDGSVLGRDVAEPDWGVE